MTQPVIGFGAGLYGGGGYGNGVDAPLVGYGSGGYGSGPYGEVANPYGFSSDVTEDYFLLAEDYALKQHLGGLLVADQNNSARRVGVWFGMPDQEIRAQAFPFITIDLIDVIENRPQVHNTYGPLDDGHFDYMPTLPPRDQNYALGAYMLSPMLLVYQISTWARHPRHDRAMLTRLQHGPLHPRFAQIVVPADNTVRRLVVTNFAKRDTTTPIEGKEKRLFRNIWTIQIPSEIFYDSVDLTARVQSVIINDATTTKAPPATVVTPILYPGIN